jgi:photosystem II stability/assembly factor-like uncharacterized protein
MTSARRGWLTLQRGDIEGTWDGGRTWRSLIPEFYNDAGWVGPPVFVDPQYGWLADGCAVYCTTDGGIHWYAAILAGGCGGAPPPPVPALVAGHA